MDVQVGDVIITKKPHPCGANRFDVLRVGMDFKIRCQKCGHEIMLPRVKIEKNIKKILRSGEESRQKLYNHPAQFCAPNVRRFAPMFDDLSQVKRRYEELAYRMTTPEAMNDPAAYAAMMREYKELTPLVEAYCSYTALQKEVDEEKALLDAPTEDVAFNDMVQQELRENWQKLEGLEQKIRLLLLPKDANDEKSIIMEIRAGAGGEEAALFAHSLHRMYTMYAVRQNWACSVISLNETELGGVKEITFSIEGPGVYSRLKFESGVHRVQRVPETETQGRIHTSTATVAVMPEAEEVELELNPKDLRIDTFRSSGAGGQHINKTSSAIRVTHLPTGMVVECQDQRSQRENKEQALKVLRSRLLQQKQEAYDQEYNAKRQSQVGSGDRSEKIRTYNFPQDRVTDHRIGLTLRNLQDILDGNLDRVIEPLILADQEEKLKNNPIQ